MKRKNQNLFVSKSVPTSTSSFSSNSVHLSGKRQKRQKKSKESRFFTFDMSNKDHESIRLVSQHDKIFVKLLEEVCNGQDLTLGNAKDDKFWRNFADKFCQKSGLVNKEGMHITCQHYCDNLKLGYKNMKKTTGLYRVDPPSEYTGKLTRIFDGRTPSTSTRRGSQSRGSTSCGRSGHGKLELRDALAELAYSRDLPFKELDNVAQFVSKSKFGLHAFLSGTKEYRASVVRDYLGTNHPETEIEDTIPARNY